jgi:Domain of unknown function (DUF4258)
MNDGRSRAADPLGTLQERRRRYEGPILHRPRIWRASRRASWRQEEEVRDVLTRPLEDRPGPDGSRVPLGETASGRYLRVICVPRPEPDSVFVITAYWLGPKTKQALRRRRRRKP